MCGRYVLFHDSYVFEATFAETRIDMSRVADWMARPHYKIKPTQQVAAIVSREGEAAAFPMRWGIIPRGTNASRLTGAGSAKRLPALINARDDRLGEAWPYKLLFKSNRCLIPASGFYEWKKPNPGTATGDGDKTKRPHYIRMRSEQPFMFAGLWDSWTDSDGSKIASCTIVTTQPNSLVEAVHDRMPVILPPDASRQWLRPGDMSIGDVRELALPYDPTEMELFEVSKAVDKRDGDGPELIQPLPLSLVE
jgi:putative SOS response-associated peptidase YedK